MPSLWSTQSFAYMEHLNPYLWSLMNCSLGPYAAAIFRAQLPGTRFEQCALLPISEPAPNTLRYDRNVPTSVLTSVCFSYLFLLVAPCLGDFHCFPSGQVDAGAWRSRQRTEPRHMGPRKPRFGTVAWLPASIYPCLSISTHIFLHLSISINLSVFIYIYISMHPFIYPPLSLCVHVRGCVYLYMYEYMSVCMYMYSTVHIHMCMYLQTKGICICTKLSSGVYVHSHLNVRVLVRACIHVTAYAIVTCKCARRRGCKRKCASTRSSTCICVHTYNYTAPAGHPPSPLQLQRSTPGEPRVVLRPRTLRC